MAITIPHGLNKSGFVYDNETQEQIYLNLDLDFYYIYALPPIAVVVIILQTITFFIFARPKFFDRTFYKYLKVESLLISFNCLLQVFRPFCFYRSSWISKSYAAVFYENYLLYATTGIFEMSSILIRIVSIIEVYLLTTKNNVKSTRLSGLFAHYKRICLVIFLFSCVSLSYQYFVCQIEPKVLIEIRASNEVVIQRVIYKCMNRRFKDTKYKQVLEMLVFLGRDGFGLCIIIYLNFLLYFKLHKMIKFKSKLAFTNLRAFQFEIKVQPLSSNQIFPKNSNDKAKMTAPFKVNKMKTLNRKLIFMTILGSLNHVIGRLPILIVYFYLNITRWNDPLARVSRIWDDLNSISVMFVFISYWSYFFFYYFFDEHFKFVFRSFVSKFRLCFFKLK
jgi:hypothetical protein